MRFKNIQSAPEQNADIHGKENIAKERQSGAHVGQHRPTEIAGKQYRAEHRSARRAIQHQTDQFDNADRHGQTQRKTETRKCRHHRRYDQDMNDAVKRQKQHHDHHDNPPHP